MRNRRKQRALKRAGIPREEPIPAYNAEHYADPVPRAAVENILREAMRGREGGGRS